MISEKSTKIEGERDIDVWEGTSGASRGAPRFGLKSNSVSNSRKKIRKSTKKLKILLEFS